MPELPEVETIRRDLTKTIIGQCIQSVDVYDDRVLRQPAMEFKKRLVGFKLMHVMRRGKALIITLSNGEFLVVQVMMTGQLIVNGKKEKATRISFKLDQSTLLYNDQRLFGQLRVVKDLKEVKHLQMLGPEPLEEQFSKDYARTRLNDTTRPIKNVLLDGNFVAGIGNIYASEILFRCKIDPIRPAKKVSNKEIDLLISKTRSVLNEAIALRGSSMRNYVDGAGKKGTFNSVIAVYAREKQPCINCQAPIVRVVQAGRSTFYCKKCQR